MAGAAAKPPPSACAPREKDLVACSISPLSLTLSRLGQEIVDAAVKSAKLKRAVKLAP